MPPFEQLCLQTERLSGYYDLGLLVRKGFARAVTSVGWLPGDDDDAVARIQAMPPIERREIFYDTYGHFTGSDLWLARQAPRPSRRLPRSLDDAATLQAAQNLLEQDQRGVLLWLEAVRSWWLAHRGSSERRAATLRRQALRRLTDAGGKTPRATDEDATVAAYLARRRQLLEG